MSTDANPQHAGERAGDGRDRRTDRQTDKQTDRMGERETDRDRQTSREREIPVLKAFLANLLQVTALPVTPVS